MSISKLNILIAWENILLAHRKISFEIVEFSELLNANWKFQRVSFMWIIKTFSFELHVENNFQCEHFWIWSWVFDLLLEQHFRIKNSEKKQKLTIWEYLSKCTYEGYIPTIQKLSSWGQTSISLNNQIVVLLFKVAQRIHLH